MKRALPAFLILSAAATLDLSARACAHTPATTNALPESAEVASCIRDLGDDRYEVREKADGLLRSLGLPAVSALRRAAESRDPEVRARAREILNDVVVGITPEWPDDVAEWARGFPHEESDVRRRATIKAVAEHMGTKSVAFLVTAMGRTAGYDADTALACFKSLDRATMPWTLVTDLVAEPKTRQQAEVLVMAWEARGDPLTALNAVKQHAPDSGRKRELIAEAVKAMKSMREEGRFEELIATAKLYAAAATNEGRFLYLQADALVNTGRDRQADALRRKALELNPADEAPHYTCGELLSELDRPEWSADEWRRILAIPPANGVYDMNAWARLGVIHAKAGDYARAADFYEALLKTYTAARKHSSGYGMIGTDVESLAARVQRLRALARRQNAIPPECNSRRGRSRR